MFLFPDAQTPHHKHPLTHTHAHTLTHTHYQLIFSARHNCLETVFVTPIEFYFILERTIAKLSKSTVI